MTKYNLKVTNMGIIAMLISLSFMGIYSCNAPEAQPSEEVVTSTPIFHPVISTVLIKKRAFDHYFEVQGSVVAKKNALIVPEMGGLIEQLNVREGQYIRKGHVIAKFNTDVVRSSKKEIEEQLDVAQYIFEKQVNLNEKGVGTELELKQATGRYNALKKSLSTLNTRLAKFILKAPFAGYVEEVFPTQGQLAGPTTPIIRLINLNDLMVTAEVSESYIRNLSLNNPVKLTFPALDEYIDDLHINRIGKMVNPIDRTVRIEVKIPNPSDKMIPNLMAIMRIRDYTNDQAIVIPSRTILKNAQQEDYVLVVQKDSTVAARTITKGTLYKNETEVLEGLQEGEIIVDKGLSKIVNGDKVSIKNN